MRGPLISRLGFGLLAAFTCLTSPLVAFPAVRNVIRSDRYRLRTSVEPETRVLGEQDGVVLTSLTADERLKMKSLLFRQEGGGATVEDFIAIQTRFLDSQCAVPPLPALCNGVPCNVVLLLWTENVPKSGNINVSLDGRLLGALPALPADEPNRTNGVNIVNMGVGPHTFFIESEDNGSTAEVTITVLDSLPFSDPEPTCEEGNVDGKGTCELLIQFNNPGPFPDDYAFFLDDVFLGAFRGDLVTGIAPMTAAGHHCVTVVGLQETAEGIYRGCFKETCCDLTCKDTLCDPPSNLLLCQYAYGAANENQIRAAWANGEATYTAVHFFADAAPAGDLPGNTTLALSGGLPPGEHTLGVQGDCGPDGLSTTTAGTITLLTQTPHSSPIDGKLQCAWTEAAGGTTTLTWTNDAPSVFIDVFIVVGADLAYVGTIPGALETIGVFPTVPEDALVLQFFALVGGGCYGSEQLSCTPPPIGNGFIRGICNGLGGTPQITSAVFTFNFLFLGGPPPSCAIACDANGEGGVNLTDGVYVLNFLFLGGPAPANWVDSNADGVPDPTCERAPVEDCAMGNPACP